MARQPGGYIPVDADEYSEKYHRVITPITQRNRQREQIFSKIPQTNKEYGNFSWHGEFGSYEPTTVKSKKEWKTREIKREVDLANERGVPSPVMSNPNYAGHSQYKREIERYRKAMGNTDSPRTTASYSNSDSFLSNGGAPRGFQHAAPQRASPERKSGQPAITQDNLRVSDIRRVDLVVHLNDNNTMVLRDVAFKPSH